MTTLAKIGSMKVISRTSVMEYRDTTKKIPEIAAELGVANILEGGVQRAGNQVRINVQLIDAGTDEHLWAEIYDRELTAENLFAIQSEISKAIADALHATLSPEEIDRIDAVPTTNLDAFDHYLRGRKHMATRAVDDLERATQEFLAAVDIDPGFALAWVGVADAHNLLVDYKGLPERVFDNVRDDAINRALDLDPGLGEAYASLGSLLHDQGDFERAEEALRTAIRYSPNYSTSYHWLSHMLVRFPARAPEALPYARRAMELDPNSAIILSNLAFSYLVLGDLDNAVRYFEQQIEAQPDFTVAYGGYSGTLRLLGDLAGAIEAQRMMIELDPDSVQTSWSLALNYASVGAFEEADAVSRSMQERFPDRGLTRAIGPVIALAKGENPPIRGAVTAALQNELSTEAGMWLGYVALLGDEFDLAYEAYRRVAPNELADETVSDDFLNWWLGALCELSWVLLETEGNEAFGKDVLDASIRMYETGFHEDIRNKERYGWSLCYLLADDEEAALDVLQRELDQNSAGSWPWQLKTPPYDAIRDDPRFLAMQSEFERRTAEQLAILRNASKRPAFEF